MQIQVISVAQKMPAWVDAACDEYSRRMPRELALKFVTLPLGSRKSKQSSADLKQRESAQIMEKLATGSMNIALDENGDCWNSKQWSQQLKRWMFDFPRVNLIIGGPDGLSETCLRACQQRVAFGRITMPHALVRVVLIEQLYRASTILQGHPYHRE